eukprot:5778735-Prymnesium_polylepis.1
MAGGDPPLAFPDGRGDGGGRHRGCRPPARRGSLLLACRHPQHAHDAGGRPSRHALAHTPRRPSTPAWPRI